MIWMKIENLATKSDITDNYHEIGMVRNEVEVLRCENKQLKEEVEKLKRDKEVDWKNVAGTSNMQQKTNFQRIAKRK